MPLYAFVQVHVYDVTQSDDGTHVPPFAHGFDAHGVALLHIGAYNAAQSTSCHPLVTADFIAQFSADPPFG